MDNTTYRDVQSPIFFVRLEVDSDNDYTFFTFQQETFCTGAIFIASKS